MQENLLFGLFVALPLVAGVGLYLFFVRYRLHETTEAAGAGRWPRIVAGNALLLLFLVGLVVLCGETYYRFFYDTTDAFALSKTTTRWFDRHYRYNRVGFRDDVEYVLRARPGSRRITFLGDSFTAGHGVADVDDRFANRIRALGADRGWEVHVLARNGWDTGNELRYLETELGAPGRSAYEFDEVVLVYCLNDVSDLVGELDEIRERVLELFRGGYLTEHSYFFDKLQYLYVISRHPEILDYYSFVREAYAGDLWDAQQRRLERLETLVRRRGGRLLVVTFPFLHSPAADYAYRDAHRKLAELWERLGVPHLDLYETFASSTPEAMTVGANDPHPNERAHALAAGAIDGFLEANVPGWAEPVASARSGPAP